MPQEDTSALLALSQLERRFDNLDNKITNISTEQRNAKDIMNKEKEIMKKDFLLDIKDIQSKQQELEKEIQRIYNTLEKQDSKAQNDKNYSIQKISIYVAIFFGALAFIDVKLSSILKFILKILKLIG
ncbi:hypothetical protein [Campylobacter mucosalis]|uniref:Uncharacterized protein n=1 Tax=Campylobacter mucosalis CCUG 21559 TaxID=1032067 RepID=A0A6G5QH37_9BACT|nr:hypothetical protein [Campylobacter mucosalis]QCD44934.1 hypothetical protein CMUC_1160 [Campylobacter mucosalis CCUG 21559]